MLDHHSVGLIFGPRAYSNATRRVALFVDRKFLGIARLCGSGKKSGLAGMYLGEFSDWPGCVFAISFPACLFFGTAITASFY